MNEIVNTQTLLFLKAIEIGILMGMLYDLVRIFRKILPHPTWLLQLEDIVYWLVCMVFGFAILYTHNYASIRFFVFIGMTLGAIFYLATFSILFMKFATWLIELVRKVVRYIWGLIMIPVRWIVGLIKIPLRFLRQQGIRLGLFTDRKVKQGRRRLYYIESDLKSGINVKRNKNIYKKQKTE